MAQFFMEGGFAMIPVTLMGIVLLGASIRYAIDGEPVRLRFVGLLSLALVAAMIVGTWLNVASVFHFMQTVPEKEFNGTLMTGLMESTRPGILGGALLVLALVLLAIGAYHSGARELKAMKP